MTSSHLLLFATYLLITIAIETPILLIGLSPRHPISRRLFAGLWLNACSYPIVFFVFPEIFDPSTDRLQYLLVAEIFAPLSECFLFWLAFHQGIDSKDPVPFELPVQHELTKTDAVGGIAEEPDRREDQTGVQKDDFVLGVAEQPAATSEDLQKAPIHSPVEQPTLHWQLREHRWSFLRDMITIILANLASFGLGELMHHFGWLPTS